MNSKIKVAFKYLVFLVIAILLVWLSVKNFTADDFQKIKVSFANANYWMVGLAMLLGLISHLLRAFRWNMLLKPMGHEPKVKNTFLAVLIGYLANLAFPRLGEVTRCTILNRYHQIPIEKSFGTVVTERLIDMLTLGILLMFVMFTQFDLYFSKVNENILQPLFSKSSSLMNSKVIGLVIFSIILTTVGIILFVRRRKSQIEINSNKTPAFQKFKLLLKGFWEGIVSVRRVEKKGVLILLSIAIWMLYASTNYFSFFALQETAHLGVLEAVSLVVWGSFGFILVQGGLGASQLICMEVLVLYGIDRNTGFALGWIIWGSQTLNIVVFGSLAFLILPIINKSNEHTIAKSQE